MEIPNLLSVSHIKVKFGSHLVLDDVSFEIKRDETLAIIGPNGAGKSVLFRTILGLVPYFGKVTWAPDARIGYVPQKLGVAKDIPITVSEFLRYKEKDKKRIEATLVSVGFNSGSVDIAHSDRRILSTRLGDLSGGELQRVLIAYAMLGNPNVLLFDEPTTGIDVGGEETIYGLIHKLKGETDLAIVFISHELHVVYKYADNVLCLNKEKVCFGPPMEVIDKENLAKLYGEDIKVYKHEHD